MIVILDEAEHAWRALGGSIVQKSQGLGVNRQHGGELYGVDKPH
jgi:hypothetical protein